MTRYRDELDALAQVTRILLEPRDPADLAHHLLSHAARVFRARAGVFYLAEHGGEPELLVSLRIPADRADSLAAELLETLRRERNAPRLLADPAGAHGEWTGGIAVPVDPGPAGVLALFHDRPDSNHTPRDARLLRLIARHGAVAARRAQERARARREAEALAVRAEGLEYVQRALEDHARDVEANLAARGRFFAFLSHELRTPINAILGYNQLLEQGVYGALDAGQAEAVGKVTSAANQLLALVNDILDLARIDTGKLEIRASRVDLATLVAEAAAGLELQARRKGLQLHVDAGAALPAVQTDPTRVRQIVLNLLSNAIKFTHEGLVRVVLRHRARAGLGVGAPAPPSARPGPDGWITIAVHDTGVGIPPDQFDAIFREFVQLGHPGHGIGLGLAITRRLARLLGGDLTVESEVGVRSVFTLYLPCPCPEIDAAGRVA